MNHTQLSELINSDIAKTPEDYEKVYPFRDLPADAKVTRLGPSPTGFIHLGNLFGAFVDERLAHQSNGVFYLRIEDTDDKRFVENAVETIISSLGFLALTLMKVLQKTEMLARTGIILKATAERFIELLPKSFLLRARLTHVS